MFQKQHLHFFPPLRIIFFPGIRLFFTPKSSEQKTPQKFPKKNPGSENPFQGWKVESESPYKGHKASVEDVQLGNLGSGCFQMWRRSFIGKIHESKGLLGPRWWVLLGEGKPMDFKVKKVF